MPSRQMAILRPPRLSPDQIRSLFLSDPADPTLGADAIRVFDRADTLTGNVAPSRTITGSATQLGQPGGLIVDSAGRLIVSNSSPARITIYSNAAAASGNVIPAS